jgi:hypothetical protein
MPKTIHLQFSKGLKKYRPKNQEQGDVRNTDKRICSITGKIRKQRTANLKRARSLFRSLSIKNQKEFASSWNSSTAPKDPLVFIATLERWLKNPSAEIKEPRFVGALRKTFVMPGETRAEKIREVFTADEIKAIDRYADAELLLAIATKKNDGTLGEVIELTQQRVHLLSKSLSHKTQQTYKRMITQGVGEKGAS